MKKHFILSFLSLINLIFFSCDEKKYSKNLVPTETIYLPSEDYVLTSTACLEYININKNKFLYYLTNNVKTNTNEILVYNLTNKTLHKKIIFNKENGFNNSIHGFSILDEKHMLVSNILQDTLFLTDLYGKILDKYPYNYTDKKTGQIIFKLFSRNEKPIKLYKNKLYFSPSLYTDKSPQFNNLSIAFSYDLENKKTDNLNVKFPSDFLNSKYFNPNVSYCFNNSFIVFSPNNSHNILAYDIDKKRTKEYKIESDYFRNFCETENKEVKMTDAMYNIIAHSTYTEIVYDKYREIYYRFFYHGMKIDKDDDNLASKANHFEKMSIIILDKNFNKVGEIFFENKFRFYSNFITEDGLYVCSNLPNEKDKVKKLKYTLLKLSGNEK